MRDSDFYHSGTRIDYTLVGTAVSSHEGFRFDHHWDYRGSITPLERPLAPMRDSDVTDNRERNHVLLLERRLAPFEGWGNLQVPNQQVGWPFSQWLLRIDYIFYSDQFEAVEAKVGRWDGISDHRPVMATFVWNLDKE